MWGKSLFPGEAMGCWLPLKQWWGAVRAYETPQGHQCQEAPSCLELILDLLLDWRRAQAGLVRGLGLVDYQACCLSHEDLSLTTYMKPQKEVPTGNKVAFKPGPYHKAVGLCTVNS